MTAEGTGTPRLEDAQSAEAHVWLRDHNEAAQGGARRAEHGEEEGGAHVSRIVELDAHREPARAS